MNISENKTFCPMPWVNISGDTDGGVRMCCISDEYIKKPSGEKYNLGHDKVEDIINSDDYKKIRQTLIQGKEVAGCNKCYVSEKQNGVSYRKQYIHLWKDDPDLIKKYNQSLAGEDIDCTVQYYDLRFGNLCNLSCRSCFAGASSQFDKDVRALQHTTISKFHGINDKDLNSWYTTDVFTHNVNSQLENIKEYYSTGGEPTLNEKNYSILEHLIETGHSKHIVVKFNTNLTNTKKDFYSLLPHFKQIIVLGSVDGYKGMQEYLRYPSDWEQISNNINKLLGMKLDNLKLIMTPVIQKTNLGYITELFEYVEQINREYNKSVVFMSPIILIDPSYLDFSYLPTDYKIKCWEKIEKWINEKCKYQDEVFHFRMKQAKTKCFAEVDYQENLDRFFEFTEIFDIHRSQNIKDINPELYAFRV